MIDRLIDADSAANALSHQLALAAAAAAAAVTGSHIVQIMNSICGRAP